MTTIKNRATKNLFCLDILLHRQLYHDIIPYRFSIFLSERAMLLIQDRSALFMLI